MKTILVLVMTLVLWTGCTHNKRGIDKIVLISANAEWNVVKEVFPEEKIQSSPWGEYFYKELSVAVAKETVIFFHGGWGKVAAAGSTQYCIDQWNPRYLINLGTCGGFEGDIKKFDIILVDKTVIYDIAEAMGDSRQAINDYSTPIDLSWLGTTFPTTVTKTEMVSADQDIVPAQIPMLKAMYGAIAADWETGAIAYTCSRNGKRILILRGVSDVVSLRTGEAYQNETVFKQGTAIVMKKLLSDLPMWLERCH